MQQGECVDCIHKPFTAVLLDFFTSHGAGDEACRQLQAVLRDVALTSTCSSQSVEKLHAHVQVSQNTLANSGRRPCTVQRESYILSARIAHARLKGLIEAEVFGPGGLVRARKLMGGRVISHTRAANTSLRDYSAAAAGSGRQRSKYVRQHVLKLGRTHRTQQAPNLWHAFLALQKGQKLRDDTEGMSDRYKQWLNNPSRRAQLLEKATTMAAQRRDLADNTLSTPVETEALSERQKRRLGQARLDKSLSALVNHPAWQQGLLVQDSNAALAGRHVLSDRDITVEQCKEEADDLFQFDGRVVENPSSFPTAFRTCHELHGGLCSCKPGRAEAWIHFMKLVSFLT